MDAPCEIQRSIHVFRLVNNMCPGKWVHITYIWYYLFVISVLADSYVMCTIIVINNTCMCVSLYMREEYGI